MVRSAAKSPCSREVVSTLCAIPLAMLMATALAVDFGMYKPTVSAECVWFYLWVGLSFFSVAALVWIYGKPVHFHLADIGVVVMSGISLAVTYISYDGYIGAGFINTLLLTVLYALLRVALSQKRGLVHVLCAVFLVTVLAEAVWGIMQWAGVARSANEVFPITGSFSNPGPYAGYLAVGLSVAFFYLWRDRRLPGSGFGRRNLFLYFRFGLCSATFVLASIMLATSQSRTAWLAAGAGIVTVAIFSIGREKSKHITEFVREHRVGTAAGCMAFMAALIAAGVWAVNIKPESADGRLLMWKIGAQTAIDNPLGVGAGRFAGAIADHQIEYLASSRASTQQRWIAGDTEYAFSEPLRIAVESGVVALALFLTIVVASVVLAVRRREAAPAAAITALFVFSLASYPFGFISFRVLLTFLVAWALTPRRNTPTKKTYGKTAVWTAMAACACALIFALPGRIPMRGAYKEWLRAYDLYHNSYYAEGAGLYDNLYPKLFDEPQMTYQYAFCLYRLGEHQKSLGLLEETKRYTCHTDVYMLAGLNWMALGRWDMAEDEFIKAAGIFPSLIRPRYLLALLYERAGRPEQARREARKVLYMQHKGESLDAQRMKRRMKELIDKNSNHDEN